MFKIGLLILTQPLAVLQTQLPRIVQGVSRVVSETLYVHLQPQTKQIGRFSLTPVPCTTEIQKLIQSIYTCGFSSCQQLNIRVLLAHVTNQKLSVSQYRLNNGYNVVIIDSDNLNQFGTDKSSVLPHITSVFPIAPSDIPVQLLKELMLPDNQEKTSSGVESSENYIPLETYDKVVLGGTFDQLHIGHKILISEGCIRCDKKLTVGVSEGEMNNKKVLNELMEPLALREEAVREFIQDVKPTIIPDVVTIYDPFGPTIVDPDFKCIILSEETKKGGDAVDTERQKRGMTMLKQVVISLIHDEHHVLNEERKVSSSSRRKRLLGTLIRPVMSSEFPFSRIPYRIGLTGGTASGKSSICRRLEGLGAGIINCDELGHQAYIPGSAAYDAILKEFGKEIVKENGEIDRGKLGPIVFSDKSQLDRLNEIVWPKILQLAEKQVDQFGQEGKKVVILDAAVLLEAGWDRSVHEVWTTVIPKDEAIKRLVERNKLSEEEATRRFDSQLANKERIAKSNVVLCTLWEPEYTQMQCERAWNLLISRL